MRRFERIIDCFFYPLTLLDVSHCELLVEHLAVLFEGFPKSTVGLGRPLIVELAQGMLNELLVA